MGGGKPYLPDRDPDPVCGNRYPAITVPAVDPWGSGQSDRDQLWVLGVPCPRALRRRPFGSVRSHPSARQVSRHTASHDRGWRRGSPPWPEARGLCASPRGGSKSATSNPGMGRCADRECASDHGRAGPRLQRVSCGLDARAVDSRRASAGRPCPGERARTRGWLADARDQERSWRASAGSAASRRPY
jgi:hypothetical protein